METSLSNFKIGDHAEHVLGYLVKLDLNTVALETGGLQTFNLNIAQKELIGHRCLRKSVSCEE